MDYLKLLYEPFLNLLRKDDPNTTLPNYTVFLAKLCQLLVLDGEGYSILRKTLDDYENMVNTQAQEDLDKEMYEF